MYRKRSRAMVGRSLALSAVSTALLGAISISAQCKSVNTFKDYLSEGYHQMSAAAQRLQANPSLVSYYANRSVIARSGDQVLPEEPNARYLDSWTMREATFARQNLI